MQLGLFASADAPDFSEEQRLARQLPPDLRLGTSSWTFPGWERLVYPPGTTLAELRRRGLELYCKNPLFRSVGIDSSFYRPASAATLAGYARQLPPGFRCVSKVAREVTSRVDARSLAPNPHYLDAGFFEREVLGPIASSFGDYQGPLVLVIPELPHAPPVPPRLFAERLSRFFDRVSRSFSYAVELRDRLLLGPEYVDALQRHGVAHVFNYWERMPELSEQRRLVDIDSAGFGVVRLLIPPGMRYADRKRQLEPFDRIASVQTAMREQTLSLIEAFAERRVPLYVIANNKAEGSSPLTVRGLAEEWAARGYGAQPGSEASAQQSGADAPVSRLTSPKRC